MRRFKPLAKIQELAYYTDNVLGDYLIKYLIFTVAFGFLVSCAGQSDDYVFRNDDRAVYTKTINVNGLAALKASNVTLIDVRLTEDLAKSPDLIAGATHRNPELISDWVSSIPRNKPVVVYCVKGKWVSQKAAAYLNEQGYDVYSLDGGINAWNASSTKSTGHL